MPTIIINNTESLIRQLSDIVAMEATRQRIGNKDFTRLAGITAYHTGRLVVTHGKMGIRILADILKILNIKAVLTIEGYAELDFRHPEFTTIIQRITREITEEERKVDLAVAAQVVPKQIFYRLYEDSQYMFYLVLDFLSSIGVEWKITVSTSTETLPYENNTGVQLLRILHDYRDANGLTNQQLLEHARKHPESETTIMLVGFLETVGNVLQILFAHGKCAVITIDGETKIVDNNLTSLRNELEALAREWMNKFGYKGTDIHRKMGRRYDISTHRNATNIYRVSSYVRIMEYMGVDIQIKIA